jgi:hypothetical protein
LFDRDDYKHVLFLPSLPSILPSIPSFSSSPIPSFSLFLGEVDNPTSPKREKLRFNGQNYILKAKMSKTIELLGIKSNLSRQKR